MNYKLLSVFFYPYLGRELYRKHDREPHFYWNEGSMSGGSNQARAMGLTQEDMELKLPHEMKVNMYAVNCNK